MRIFERVVIGSDPWAGNLHRHLAAWLREAAYEVEEVNTAGASSTPYYEIARSVGTRVAADPTTAGIVLCGTGMGIAMEANAVPGVSCALCEHPLTAEKSRVLNNANVLAMGEMVTTPMVAEAITRTFLTTEFGAGIAPELLAQIKTWHTAIRRWETAGE